MKKFLSVIISVFFIFNVFCCISNAAEKNKFYLVLGDSIAYGSGLKNPEEACYGKIVADSNGYDYSNHSVPGHSSNDLLNIIAEEDVIEDFKKADIISISIGGNDFLTDSASDLIFDSVLENDYSHFDKIAEEYYINISKIISTIKNYNSNAVILMQNLYNPQSGDLKEICKQGTDRINEAISLYESDHPGEIIIIDTASALNGNSDNFAKDGIHPSAKGNEKIAKLIIDKLYSMNLSDSAEMIIKTKGKDISVNILLNLTIKILTIVVKFIAFLYGFI